MKMMIMCVVLCFRYIVFYKFLVRKPPSRKMPGVGSGVTVMDDCVKEFENMKKQKSYYGIVYK